MNTNNTNARDIEDIYELSPMQQGMLFHSLSSSDAQMYFEQLSWTLEGPLDVTAFRRAWELLIARHPVLRTSFHWEGLDKPLQVVHKCARLPLFYEDWSDLSKTEQEKRLSIFRNADRRREWQFSEAPLIRLSLIRLGDDLHEFILGHHHILLDGWSLMLVLKEFNACYEAGRLGITHKAESTRQYRDYINWLQRQDRTASEAYWRRTLAGFKTATPLAQTRRPQNLRGKDNDYNSHRAVVPFAVTSRLNELVGQWRLTLSTAIYGVWSVLLSRCSGAMDIMFGATMSGRPAELGGSERVVGLCINTLPVRAIFSEGEPILECLQRFQQQLVELRKYESNSLNDIQGWSEIPRGEPLFESLLVVENYPAEISPSMFIESLKTRNFQAFERTNYPLTIVISPGRELHIQAIFDVQRFEDADIERMSERFNVLLEGIISHPHLTFSDLRILSESERRQLLDELSRPRTSDTASNPNQCVHELFSEQAARTPEAVALVDERQSLSYRELDRRSNQLAHYLRARGVGPESVVGLMLDRGVEMVVALLGALKAGAAYLPLDHRYPEPRLRLMIEDGAVKVALAQSDYLERLRDLVAEVVCLDLIGSDLAQSPDHPPFTPITPDNLIYINYTSGSTGKPKGVGAIHRGVVRLLLGADYVELDESQTLLQMAPLSFDAATFELWGALLHGGRLALFGEQSPGVESLGRALARHGVTTLWLTTSLFNLVIDEAPGILRGVRQLLVGGEALSVSHMRRARQLLPETELINGYGPTEGTTFTSSYRLNGMEYEGRDRIPIGRPINKTRVYVTDVRGELAPVGVVGELYIGGDGLARGYLRSAEETAEKFIPDPYGGVKGGRLYRSGDQVRFDGDGNMEFMGRADGQIKLRGHRIEYGEIEAALKSCEGVKNAAVTLKEEAGGEKRLVGYVVCEEGCEGEEELRRRLKETLPGYLVPWRVVKLKELPLSEQGKVDRRALPEVGGQREEEEKREGPRGGMEEMVAVIWERVLGVEGVGREENFFELGGHSLVATQVVSRIREAAGVELGLREMFEEPTVKGLAREIERRRGVERRESVPEIKRARQDGAAPLSYAQQRLWFLDRLSPENSTFNVLLCLELLGKTNHATLERALNEIVRRHETFRTHFDLVSGKPVQVINPHETFSLPLIDFSHLSESKGRESAQEWARKDAARPFDLGADKLFRSGLLKISDDERLLVLVAPHILMDGWSAGLFIDELAQTYTALINNSPLPPDLKIQYADYALWERAWLQGAVFERLLEYWVKQFDGRLPTYTLPTDKPRPAVQSYIGARESLSLDKRFSDQLKIVASREGVTLYMLLLAGFNILLSYFSKQDDIVVGADVANRSLREAEEIIGFFVNQIPLRTRLSEKMTFGDLLSHVRKTTIEAWARQELPFNELVKALNPARSLQYSPLFQVKLALQNASPKPYQLPGLLLTPLLVDYGGAKLDLILFLQSGPDGITGVIEYNTDLYYSATIRRLKDRFISILQIAVETPEIKLIKLKEILRKQDQQEKAEMKMGPDFNRLKQIKPKAISVPKERLIDISSLWPDKAPPVVFSPGVDEVVLSEWARDNVETIERQLLDSGAILFRGFKVNSVPHFESLARAVSSDLFNENGEHPRETVSGNVYTPIAYAADKLLLWHNENSFNHQWPGKIWFCCLKAAQEGGETLLVDSRQVFRQLDFSIRERFRQKKIMYVRNYGMGVGLEWQTVFRTQDKAEVERRCKATGMEFEWRRDGALRTRCVRQAVINHPKTDETVWFNQAQHWHLSCLDQDTRNSLLAICEEDGLPRNCYYGDGTPIEDSVMAEILGVYRELSAPIPWEPGDVLLLDNMLTAHGRSPYLGERKLLVAMGEMISSSDIR